MPRPALRLLFLTEDCVAAVSLRELAALAEDQAAACRRPGAARVGRRNAKAINPKVSP